MNRSRTKQLVEANGVVTLKADSSRPSSEIDTLLEDLGNAAGTLPFYAVYPADGTDPIVFGGPITQGYILEILVGAGPSAEQKRVASSATPLN